MKEALSKLHAPHEPGEPLDVETFHRYRLDQLRANYPDVAELIGCLEPDAVEAIRCH